MTLFSSAGGRSCDRRLLVAQRVLGVLAPQVGGADDDAVVKGFLPEAVKKLSMSAFWSL
jgi:hypothetical protein